MAVVVNPSLQSKGASHQDCELKSSLCCSQLLGLLWKRCANKIVKNSPWFSSTIMLVTVEWVKYSWVWLQISYHIINRWVWQSTHVHVNLWQIVCRCNYVMDLQKTLAILTDFEHMKKTVFTLKTKCCCCDVAHVSVILGTTYSFICKWERAFTDL